MFLNAVTAFLVHPGGTYGASTGDLDAALEVAWDSSEFLGAGNDFKGDLGGDADWDSDDDL